MIKDHTNLSSFIWGSPLTMCSVEKLRIYITYSQKSSVPFHKFMQTTSFLQQLWTLEQKQSSARKS